MELTRNGILITCQQGDITEQKDVDVIVNAANAELMPGGGVAGAIHRRAGPELANACRKKAPIRPGESVITKGFQLPNDYVIHTLGPIYGVDKPEDKLLEQCYVTSLKLAETEGLKKIAFPAISTGAFGYPFEEALKVAVSSVLVMSKHLAVVKEIRFVLYSKKDHEAYESYLSNL